MSNYFSYSPPSGTQLISFTLSFTLQTILVPANISDIINDHLILDESVIPLGIALMNRNADVSAFQPSCKYHHVLIFEPTG